MSLNLRQTLRRWTTSTGIGGPIHRNTHPGARNGASNGSSLQVLYLKLLIFPSSIHRLPQRIAPTVQNQAVFSTIRGLAQAFVRVANVVGEGDEVGGGGGGP